MKKIFFFIFLVINSLNILGVDQSNINDYKRFVSGKNYLINGNYEDAMNEFEILVKKHPDSQLFKSNYANYYIGMTCYNLGDYSQAIFFLERAVYIPNEFKIYDPYFKTYKKHFFEYERNYYLGKIYLEQGAIEEALKHFKFLIKNYYSPDLETYEILGLKELGKYEPYYEILYRVKYENALAILPSLRDEDILMTGDFFLSKGLYTNAEKAYSYYLNLESKDAHKVRLSLLESLKMNNKYDAVVDNTLKFISSDSEDKSEFYYYLAAAYMQLGNIKKAEEYFPMVTSGKYKIPAMVNRGRLHYLKSEYSDAISILEEIDDNAAHDLLMETYLKSGLTDEFKKTSIDYIKKYPYSDQAAYYRFLLYKESKNPNYLNWIIKYNFNTYYYEMAYSGAESARVLEEYPLNYKMSLYKNYIKRLKALAELEDFEILKIEFENLDFHEKDIIFKECLMSTIYEKGGFYHHAILNSEKYQNDFSKYSNLIPFLYPRYYDILVKKASKKYNLEEALIYSIILQESVFDPELISSSGAYGLMQIIYDTARSLSPEITQEELFIPHINIDLGSRYMKQLLARFDGDVARAVASYSAGADNVSKWASDEKGDLDIEKIPFSETKEYVKKVINNYYKYKRIYNY